MPPMVEDEMRKKKEVVESSGELANLTAKKQEVPHKMVPIPRPPPSFPQILVNKGPFG